MNDPRIIGHVVSIQGFRVKVELLEEARSPSRATLDGIHRAVTINAYLAFNIGAGSYALGIITDLEARESFDPNRDDELSLELMKPRRVASVQLLGTVQFRNDKEWGFNTGITVLPPLDTAAEIADPTLLQSIFSSPPICNKPEEIQDHEKFDFDLDIGCPTGDSNTLMKASYNDLFSRPLAIVGNTGSGKSYTVASLLQKAVSALQSEASKEPHVFILDINGEYAKAFNLPKIDRQPNCIYLNGKEFGVPIWMFNALEICAWLSASEQTQEPVLKDWWAVAKTINAAGSADAPTRNLRHALTKINQLIECLDSNRPVRQAMCRCFQIAETYWEGSPPEGSEALKALLQPYWPELTSRQVNWDRPSNERQIRDQAEALQAGINKIVSEDIGDNKLSSTADSPLFISKSALENPLLFDRAISQEDISRIENHLTTLKLRLRTRLDDKRWVSFLNYENADTQLTDLESWFNALGLGTKVTSRVSIIDLSMLGNEALPYACGVIGRTLLEAREKLTASDRYKTPWLLVLEEAHNYARPARNDEDRGHKLSRIAFERIAKEGRKFGLSLIVASQRPSEISPTIISQCANFLSHRLQNPDDIDHFRRIIPMQARRLLDQVTVLAAGEAIAFGSAFHVPSRVQITKPAPTPWSQTAAPFYEWNKDTQFPLSEIIEAWGLNSENAETIAPAENKEPDQE